MVASMVEGEIRYVRVPVFSVASPLADAVEFSFPLEGEAPTVWTAGEWTPGQTWVSGDSVEARILVGSDVTLASDTYDVWIRITDGDEQPWLEAGLLVVQDVTASVDFAQTTTQAINVAQGATFSQYFYWREGGIPQPLTGYSAKFAVAKKRGKTAAPLVEVTSAGAEIILEPPDNNNDPQTGVVWVRLTPTSTELLTLRTPGVYDLWLINVSDPTEVIRLYEGPVVVDLQASEVE